VPTSCHRPGGPRMGAPRVRDDGLPISCGCLHDYRGVGRAGLHGFTRDRQVPDWNTPLQESNRERSRHRREGVAGCTEGLEAVKQRGASGFLLLRTLAPGAPHVAPSAAVLIPSGVQSGSDRANRPSDVDLGERQLVAQCVALPAVGRNVDRLRVGLRDLCPELSRSARERRQPCDLQVSARAEQIDPRWWESGEVDLVTAPVGTAAVVVGQSVVAS
jgi:hypothetical protein